MKTLGLVMIAVGVLAILLGIVGMTAQPKGAVSIIGLVLLAGGWVLYRTSRRKEFPHRS